MSWFRAKDHDPSDRDARQVTIRPHETDRRRAAEHDGHATTIQPPRGIDADFCWSDEKKG